PIGHSRSPRIHALFAEQTGHALRYEAIRVEPGRFAAAVDAFRADGGRGLNVTVPFKQDAWRYAGLHSERAARAGAVNTLVLDGDAVYGDNTDGPGLVRDLTVNQGYPLAGRRILLLGAGGAARGVLAPLLAEGPAELVVANRTAAKATELAAAFTDLGPVTGCSLAALADRVQAGSRFDLLLNATAAGLEDRVPDLPDGLLAAGACGYDLMYGDRPTAFLRWAAAQGAARTVDGLGMLVEQAAESFLIWRGIRPETGPVIAELQPAGAA
ncbi:MAG: shikimate dehydrogenase, partial [Candidatus Competibacterales bacterium]|nr:shikimate dehydrogenase [Candidatus Competibacterales bacterium]